MTTAKPEQGHDSQAERQRVQAVLAAFHDLKVAKVMDSVRAAPELLVIGSQSSGKSSLVEALIGLPFNHTSAGTSTLVPIEFATFNNPDADRPIWSLHHRSTTLTGVDTATVEKELMAINQRLKGEDVIATSSTDNPAASLASVDPEPIRLRLEWSQTETFSFVDMPGLASNPDDLELAKKIDQLNADFMIKYSRDRRLIIVQVERVHQDEGHWMSFATTRALGDQCKPIHRIIVFNQLDRLGDSDFQSTLEQCQQYVATKAPALPGEYSTFVTSCSSAKEKDAVKGSFLDFQKLINDKSTADEQRVARAAGTMDPAVAQGMRVGVTALRNELIGCLKNELCSSKHTILQSLAELQSQLASKVTAASDELLQSFVSDGSFSRYLNAVQQWYASIFSGARHDTADLPSSVPRMTMEQENKTLRTSAGMQMWYMQNVMCPDSLQTKRAIEQRDETRALFVAGINSRYIGGRQLLRLLEEFSFSVVYSRMVQVRLDMKDIEDAMNTVGVNLGDRNLQHVAWEEIGAKLLRKIAERQFLDQDVKALCYSIGSVAKFWSKHACDLAQNNQRTELRRFPLPKVPQYVTSLVRRYQDKAIDDIVDQMIGKLVPLCQSLIEAGVSDHPVDLGNIDNSDVGTTKIAKMQQLGRTMRKPLFHGLNDLDFVENQDTALEELSTTCSAIYDRAIQLLFKMVKSLGQTFFTTEWTLFVNGFAACAEAELKPLLVDSTERNAARAQLTEHARLVQAAADALHAL